MSDLPELTPAEVELEIQQQWEADQYRLQNTLVLTRLYAPPIGLDCSECEERIEQDVYLAGRNGDVYHPYCFFIDSDPSPDEERTKWLLNLLSHVLRNAPFIGNDVNPLKAQDFLNAITPQLTTLEADIADLRARAAQAEVAP